MLETMMVSSGSVMYVMAAVGILGVLAKIVNRMTLYRLIKAAGNMPKSTHKLMKLVKAKYEHACMAHESVENVGVFVEKSTHNRRECPVYGHRGGSRGRFYYRITTFEGRPWDARDPHKTTFMTLKHAIRLSIWRKQKETPGVEKAPGVSSPQRKESGRSGRDDGELRFGYDPAIHARRLRVYHRPRRLRMALRISIILYSRRFSPANLMG